MGGGGGGGGGGGSETGYTRPYSWNCALVHVTWH